MSNVKLITLDLDNTLWDVDSVIIRAERQLLQWLNEHVPESLPHYQPEILNQIRQDVFSRFNAQSHDLSFMRTQILFEVMKRTGLSDREAKHQAAAAFDVFFEGRNQVELFVGALEMLQNLSSSFTLIALTNGNADIKKAGLADYFSGAFSAADVGNKKPHPAMFNAPLDAFKLKPSQAIHIGDHLVDDIQGASDVGMHSIWVNLTGSRSEDQAAKPSREVNHLTAVEEAVSQINSS